MTAAAIPALVPLAADGQLSLDTAGVDIDDSWPESFAIACMISSVMARSNWPSASWPW